MNEQRQQEYFNLIQSLLNCRSHDEILKTLEASQELVDFGFLQMLEAKRAMFSQQGDENKANWCQRFGMQLRETLNLDTTLNLESLSKEKIQAYLQFLIEVLQATKESNGDRQVVYPLLANNTDKLDGVLAEILHRWGTNELGKAAADKAEYLAAVIGIFSSLIEQFPLGNKISNMEIAISGYEVALTVYTQQAFPEAWAATQNNLATVYSKRIKGDRAENLERAISCYQKALEVYSLEEFSQNWATTQNNLAMAYSNRIRGDIAENLEWAISCYQNALKVYTFKSFPQDWAGTQHNLAMAYSNRIRGNIAENLEWAISCYQNTLKVYTFKSFPQDWAGTQHNLAIAYGKRIEGERAENLERAIACFQDALKVRTLEASPQDWAKTQHNLAIAYRKRIEGERTENLEQAISCFQDALKVYTLEAFPQDWAGVQRSLAIAYRERIKGDIAENLEWAIACFKDALKVYTLETFPQDWAGTQNSLAIAYRERIKGDIAENLEQAIACFKDALKVYTFKSFPQDWAITQNNLAITYRERIEGDIAENLEMAIACSRKALKVYTFDAFREQAIMMQNNLATTYLYRIKRKRAKNLQLAIAYLEKALKVYTLEAFPQDWAGTQNNLAIAYTASAYSARIRGEQAENFKLAKLAIASFESALTVYTREAFPKNHAGALYNIGIVYKEEQQFESAYNTFASAIATVESLREEIVSGEESKRKQAEQWNKLYGQMVEVCLELGKKTEAIEYVERSKTRNLVEQILSRDMKIIFPADVVTQLETYRDEIAERQYQIQNGKAEDPKVVAQHLRELRQKRNNLQNKHLRVGYDFQFDPFQATLNERTTIIEWYILNDKILAFIVTATGEVTVWESQPQERKTLGNWLNQYLQNYKEQKEQWKNSLGEELKTLASILHINEILAEIPKPWDKLILIPHQFLHLLPLHALPVSQNPENSPCLLDLFPGAVGYAPSCQLLQQMQQRDRPNFQSLFAIQNPTKDLSFADLEVESILSYFLYHQVLAKEQATKAALSEVASQLKEVNYLHFSCHGFFNLSSPQNSCLVLADSYVSSVLAETNLERYVKVSKDKAVDLSKCLTLGNLFEENLNFSQSRLVVLSACETGLIDFTNTSDEYIGLPSGFLYAGSSSVVSSLWTVNELSTSFLLIKFIQILQDATDMSVPLAMNQAQQWLRDATKEELQEWVKKLTLDSDNKGKIRRQINYKMTGEKPFNSPYHWAAFTAVGK
ncbi:hypothetical protein CDG76_11030 [Nostoc sp. 'Peltigera membranacea cyanobiont' 210A]|uniref:CHAT domain-containing protein n=1 Tax=Nostoc sp. 'Peltigera membranacea cyanobiont' 210A TaxID=2014529 RepID=UPI000B95709F|nr:CHAT domain-containing protein [Nostoc sp. 'Peltigera membranacea cyanobiont' 210A]OYD95479.1 hypothetical protein CDG76_11030 [Nostoc sp. 'Peltigera membranacea cyanobiont' 210A]